MRICLIVILDVYMTSAYKDAPIVIAFSARYKAPLKMGKLKSATTKPIRE